MKNYFVIIAALIGFQSCNDTHESDLESTTLVLRVRDYFSGEPQKDAEFSVYGIAHSPRHSIGIRTKTDEYGNYNGSFNTYKNENYLLNFESTNFTVENYIKTLDDGNFNELDIKVFNHAYFDLRLYNSIGGSIKEFNMVCLTNVSGTIVEFGNLCQPIYYSIFNVYSDLSVKTKLAGNWKITYQTKLPGSSTWITNDTTVVLLKNDTLSYDLIY